MAPTTGMSGSSKMGAASIAEHPKTSTRHVHGFTDQQLAFYSGYSLDTVRAMTPDQRAQLVRRYT